MIGGAQHGDLIVGGAQNRVLQGRWGSAWSTSRWVGLSMETLWWVGLSMEQLMIGGAQHGDLIVGGAQNRVLQGRWGSAWSTSRWVGLSVETLWWVGLRIEYFRAQHGAAQGE